MTTVSGSKAICHSYYLLFGLVGVGLLPPLVKSFEDSYELSHATMGIVLGISAVLMAASSLMGGAWYDRHGPRTVLGATMALSALSALGIYFAVTVVPFLLLLMVFHIANGLGAVVNPLVGQLYGEERAKGINLLHAFQGIGRLLAPMLVAGCIAVTGQWRPGFVVAALLFAFWFVLVWLGLEEPERPASRPSEGPAVRQEALGLLRDPVILLGLGGFALLSGCELTLMTWLPNFLESEAGFAKADALAALSSMMIGYTAIRLLLGLRRFQVRAGHIALSALLLVTGFLLVTKVGDRYSLYSLAFIMGLCFGPYWPYAAAAMYDYTAYGHGALTGLFNVGCTAGAFLFVSAVGVVGDMVSLRHGLLIAPACACAFAVTSLACQMLARRRPPHEAEATHQPRVR